MEKVIEKRCKGERKKKWTLSRLKEEALKYSSKAEFRKGSRGAYSTIDNSYREHREDICSHMVGNTKPNGYWTREQLQIEANKHTTRKEFRAACSSGYTIMKNLGKEIADEMCKHMVIVKHCNGYWTEERCLIEAKKYDTRMLFEEGNNSAYCASLKSKNREEIFKHMGKQIRGFNVTLPATLYYLSINNGQAYKIGITNNSIQARYTAADIKKIEVLKEWSYAIGREALNAESEILREFSYAKWDERDLLVSGNTELFKYDVLELDS